ncbi:dermonecrotic toxin LiSicTox-betaIA1ii [Trichonephila clavata]|uniref:Dermonecrotic toxin LiSicTox-betaIA1ii n=1 Tax=Trichonephila clavata TaxID=2740835 RepID=A0A8X6JF62_TRICU|nr:dermonecrotic toxin LiSicTox-betaIA1ii [Trichonephila clavata]
MELWLLNFSKIAVQWINLRLHAYLLILCLCLNKCVFVTAEGRRPIYVIAHMVNSIYELDEYLARGANAIEFDLTFYSNGTVRQVYHGYPCDCYRVCDERENFARYLNHIRDLSNPNHVNYQKGLTFLFLDLKLGDVARKDKYKAGEEIAKYLITHLWNKDLSEPQIEVLLSVPHASDSETIKGVRETFTKSNRETTMQKLGFDVSLNDDLNSIRRMYSRLGVTSNRWQGDGITNCLRPFRDDSRLRHAVRIRDSGSGFIEKVYDWTVDTTSLIRRSLRSGVDGIITNFPERVVSVLQEQEFKDRYRLATADDNPFSRVSVGPFKTSVQTQKEQNYVSSVQEITVAIMGYFWDFYKLRIKRPATLFPFLHEFLKKTLPFLREYSNNLRRLSRKGLISI